MYLLQRLATDHDQPSDGNREVRSFYGSTYIVYPQPLRTALLAGDARLLGSACGSVSSLKSVQIS